MSCDEFREAMPELAGGAESADHARQCPSCATLLEQHQALAAGLARLARARHDEGAPEEVERRLVEAFRAGRRPRAVVQRWVAWATAAAALLAIGLVLTRSRQPQGVSPQSSRSVQVASGAVEVNGLDTDFMPMPLEAGFSGASGAGEDDDLVEVEVPRSALVALGLPVPVDSGPGRVEAVVALRADGMLEGVRIVQ